MKSPMTPIPLPCTAEAFIRFQETACGSAAGPNEREAFAGVSEMVNFAYQDGLDGAEGYPEELDSLLADWARERGKEPTEWERQTLRWLNVWRNAAYREGRRAAGEEAEQ